MYSEIVRHRIGSLLEQDKFALLLSLMIQLSLAFFLGHFYDIRISMGTGYLVAEGLNPYEQHYLGGIFNHEIFQGITPGIGYPPPWAIILGLIYLFSYKIVHDLFLYNFAIKLPIIAANIFLAYSVRNMLQHDMKIDPIKARKAWLLMLFNPFILITTSAWGQIDGIVAFLVILSFHNLYLKKTGRSAVLLALAISLKPIALPLLPLPIIYTARGSMKSCAKYLIISLASILVLTVLPFYLLNWNPGPIFRNWDYHETVAGGLSIFGFVEALQGTYHIPDSMYLLGFLWIPAVALGYIFLHPRFNSPEEITRSACSIILIFLLTRAWVSEPNLVLLIPFLVMVMTMNNISWKVYTFAWSVPLVFAFLNTSIPQLFALIYPQVIGDLSGIDIKIRGARLMAGYLTVLVWQVTGWYIVIRLNRNLSKSRFNRIKSHSES
ncbi:MAG: glycosyltransferase 87 family protein [Candidatus Methanoperedens sp.]|nr:glycosyltransferase 87 family protein [Candidatus Methanoperedens sp.]